MNLTGEETERLLNRIHMKLISRIDDKSLALLRL